MPVRVETPDRRTHAWIAGGFQEVEVQRSDEYGALKPDQVLWIKDFILEDVVPGRATTRTVYVPAPFAGVISRCDDKNGLIEIKMAWTAKSSRECAICIPLM